MLQVFGHVRNACRSDVDRTQACFRCGQDGHQARDCRAMLRCVVCDLAGHNAGHRMGSMSCGSAVVKNSGAN